jgi:hypothetical protein
MITKSTLVIIFLSAAILHQSANFEGKQYKLVLDIEDIEANSFIRRYLEQTNFV